jgi:hypothetical protein
LHHHRDAPPDTLRTELLEAFEAKRKSPAELRPEIVRILKAVLSNAHALAEMRLLSDGDGTA